MTPGRGSPWAVVDARRGARVRPVEDPADGNNRPARHRPDVSGEKIVFAIGGTPGAASLAGPGRAGCRELSAFKLLDVWESEASS